MKRVMIMVILAGMLYACSEPTPKDTAVRNVSLTTPVLLEQIGRKNYPGIVKETHTINLGFKIAGQISYILVKEGDYVKRGQLLARLDDEDYRLGVEALQIQYDQLQDEVARTKRLFEQKSISANDFEKASAGLRQLGVQLQVEKNRLDYTRLCAPTDGYIQNVNFSPAEMVDAGTSLFTLLDVSHMEVEVDIPVNDYRQRKQFLEYGCRVIGSKETLPMKFLSLTPKADGNQLYRLRLAFGNRPDGQITAGMNVEVCISMTDSVYKEKLAVPLRAIFRDGNSSCVWVFNQDSTVSRRPVTVSGMDAEGCAVITEGLSAGEQVVCAGVNVLKDGQRVGVVKKASKTNIGGLL